MALLQAFAFTLSTIFAHPSLTEPRSHHCQRTPVPYPAYQSQKSPANDSPPSPSSLGPRTPNILTRSATTHHASPPENASNSPSYAPSRNLVPPPSYRASDLYSPPTHPPVAHYFPSSASPR